jgi:hypothetical protein
MRIAEHGDTGATLARSSVPYLGVSCSRCPHRVLLSVVQLEVHEHDRRPLWRMPLLCRCGSRDVQRVLLDTPDETHAFLAGDDPINHEGQGNGLWSPSF